MLSRPSSCQPPLTRSRTPCGTPTLGSRRRPSLRPLSQLWTSRRSCRVQSCSASPAGLKTGTALWTLSLRSVLPSMPWGSAVPSAMQKLSSGLPATGGTSLSKRLWRWWRPSNRSRSRASSLLNTNGCRCGSALGAAVTGQAPSRPVTSQRWPPHSVYKYRSSLAWTSGWTSTPFAACWTPPTPKLVRSTGAPPCTAAGSPSLWKT
mmetsp:Transcript_106680/g.183995  ORF Transcript_106680/g.183995 Transcript_106680/m.183995 type:complete len:206 (-) Transcript_106680:2060-2677(-)